MAAASGVDRLRSSLKPTHRKVRDVWGTRRQQAALMQQAEMAASARTSDRLAHQINNPLQSLTNLVYLASEEDSPTEARSLARELQGPLHRLSGLVKRLLALRHDESLSDGPGA